MKAYIKEYYKTYIELVLVMALWIGGGLMCDIPWPWMILGGAVCGNYVGATSYFLDR